MAKKKTAGKKKVLKKKTKAAPKKNTDKKPKPNDKPLGACFVMMPFKDPFDLYYETIFKPAILKANLEPVRADDLFRPSVIVGDLWQMIQDAKVLLAELTTKNANVFYELGLAHAIGKPIVLVSETMDDVPFDLQQLRVLPYDKNDPEWGADLRNRITKSIKETLDTPIEAVPPIFRKQIESQAPEQDESIARIEALENQMRTLRRQETKMRSYTSNIMSIQSQKGLPPLLRMPSPPPMEDLTQDIIMGSFDDEEGE